MNGDFQCLHFHQADDQLYRDGHGTSPVRLIHSPSIPFLPFATKPFPLFTDTCSTEMHTGPEK